MTEVATIVDIVRLKEQQFEAENPAYQYRHLVKPGLTGLAQVHGRYDTATEDKLCFDLYYVRNYSLLLDLQVEFGVRPLLNFTQ